MALSRDLTLKRRKKYYTVTWAKEIFAPHFALGEIIKNIQYIMTLEIFNRIKYSSLYFHHTIFSLEYDTRIGVSCFIRRITVLLLSLWFVSFFL